MKNETSDYYTWDDVVFENRNKSYGAYLVRQSYSRNSMIAFGVSVSFAIFLLFLPQILSHLTGGKVVLPKIVNTSGEKIIEIIHPPRLDDPVIQPPAEAPKAIVKNLPPQVTIEETITEIPPNSELLADNTISDGDGTVFIETPSGTAVTETPPAEPAGPRDYAEVMPAYEGGMQAMTKFISGNIKYPRSASAVGTEGSVFVSFVIDADGKVVDVKVVRGVSADCDKEAMRVIAKMAKWKAGRMGQTPVAVRMVLPIKFQLN